MSAVRIAGAPISWGVCEVPGWGHQMEPDRVLTEMASLGLEATEFGPLGFLPEDPEGRSEVLGRHKMTAVGGFVPIVLHDPAQDPMPAIERELDAFVASNADVMVLAAETGQAGYDAPKPEMTEELWQTLASNLSRIASRAGERGVRAVIHPHAGTMVETLDDVNEVLARTDMDFCIDTGHMWIGGTDPVWFANTHGDRVGHVHFKDVDLSVAKRVQDGEITYYDGVTKGLYTPLGQGDVDVRGITETLIRQGYTGWFVLEQDVVVRKDPESGAGPVLDAQASVEFLRKVALEAG